MSDYPILVVDDNRKIADFMANKLLPSMGYKTLIAYNGKTALDILRARPISLMILDFQLSDTSGLQILRQLDNEDRNIPTILVTAHGSEQIAVDAFRHGVQDYLTKPVDPDKLNMAISRALTESRLRRETKRLTTLLQEQVSWLTVLSKVGRSVTSTLELDEVLRRIVEAGVHLTRAEEGFLALLDDKSGQLYLRAIKNIDQDKSKNMRLPVEDSLVGSVIQSGRPLRISQKMETGPLKVCTGFLVHDLIHIPIHSRGKTLGVLSVDNQTSRRAFTEKDEALLTSLADYAAVAIENASLYEQAQQEILERKRVEQALRESEERYAIAVRGANDGLWDWDLRTNKIYYSPRWKSMFGYQNDQIDDSPTEWFSRIHTEDIEHVKLEISAHLKGVTSHFENEHRMLHKDGTYRWVLSRGIAVWDKDGVANRLAGSLADITDRKNAEEKLLHDAFYDTMTGLPNRSLFLDRLNFAVERTKRRDDYLFAVLYLDLDRFKDVNDSLGHMVGDQLLVSVGHMISSGLRSTDTVARLGGDEFVILLEDIKDLSAATRVANWILKKLASPFTLNDREVFITASIGIVMSLTGYNHADDVLRDADIAMYVAKAQGKSRYEIFNPSMRERIMERLALESDLRQAIDQDQLRIHYQPIVSLQTGKMIGLEALVRWEHPERGLVPPLEFIPQAEETGLIISIDRWVLNEACRQMREWHSMFPIDPPLSVSVNLSSKQISKPDLIEYIKEVLQETGLESQYLKLEITESAFMEYNQATVSVFNKLREMGIQVQIDDFGTGYSSLGYLHQFPISALKIDRSFVNRIGSNSNSPEIAQTVVILAHDLKIEAVAEGVETEAQLNQLRDLGCEYGQGYLISSPLSDIQVESILDELHSGKNPFKPWNSHT